MVIDDLNLICVTFTPAKTESPLIVDANAVLSFSIGG
jgi:hypothetical protein